MLERGGAEEPLLVESREVREILIENEPVKFEFAIAKDVTTDKVFRLVEGVVSGTTGDVLVMVKVDALYWDQYEELVTTMLKSIK
jgi:ribosome-interacting GTPase 1